MSSGSKKSEGNILEDKNLDEGGSPLKGLLRKLNKPEMLLLNHL